MDDGVVSEIHVYPIKSCRSVAVKSAKITATGLEHDRAWCVVDLDGVRFPEREYISQRKLPKLATVCPEFSDDGRTLHIYAPDMPRLSVPVDENEYKKNTVVTVECSGVSTTGGGGWHLGKIKGYSAGEEAQEWFTKYLNRPDVVKSSKPATRFALVRSTNDTARKVHRYAGPKQGKDALFDFNDLQVSDDDAVRFQDFSPLLLVNSRSLDDLNRRMGTSGYPISPFRANIVVSGTSDAWDEESWRSFAVMGAAGALGFRFLKECPRCTVPGRNQRTGEYHFQGGSYEGRPGKLLQPQITLSKAFPNKAADPTWRSWKGPYFGIYVAPDLALSKSKNIQVGDRVQVHRRTEAWPSSSLKLSLMPYILLVLVPVVAFIISQYLVL